MNRRRFFVLLIVGALLLLDWTALDDITTGNEPDYIGEYAWLALSAVIFAILLWTRKKMHQFPGA